MHASDSRGAIDRPSSALGDRVSRRSDSNDRARESAGAARDRDARDRERPRAGERAPRSSNSIARSDARALGKFASGKVSGTGVRLSALAVLFLTFVTVTEWVRDREGERFTAFTPRLVRQQRAVDARTGRPLMVAGENGTGAADPFEDLRTYVDHGVVRLEAEVCGSTSMMALTVFAVCASIGLNDILWTSSRQRRSVSMTVLYITIVACYTHYLMVQGSDLLKQGVEGTYYSLLRYLEWMMTTPVLLILVFQLHALCVGEAKATYRTDMWLACFADEVMLITGMLTNEVPDPVRGLCLAISMFSFTYVITKCVGLFRELLSSSLVAHDRMRFVILAIAKTFCWTSFPIVYVAKELGYIDTSAEHEWFLSCDVLTKAVYCLLLSAGNIRVLDVSRDEELADIERLTKMQRDFFFNITHELRMPLNSVIGFNTLAVESGELTDVTDGFIKNSLTSAEALLGLINQVLDYAKFNRKGSEVSGGHGLELSNDSFSLEELVDQTLSISQRADYTGNVFIRIDPSLFPMTYTTDFFRLRQCLVNLVNNALKFSSHLDRPGTVLIDVRGYLDEAEAHLTFSVEDNGVGIPEERQNAVFVPFSQQSDYSALRVQGTGLGLTITKTIIELMGGAIDFTSREDVGTKFNISLPLGYKPNEKARAPPKDLMVLIGLRPGLQMRTIRNILACYQVNVQDMVEVGLEGQDREQVQHYILHGYKSSKHVVLCIEEEQYFVHEQWLKSMNPEPRILIISKSSRMKDLPHTHNVRSIMKPVAMSPVFESLEYFAREGSGENFSAADASTPVASIMKSESEANKSRADMGALGDLDISSMRVLLVEDNRLNQQVAIHSMKKCNVAVDVAENGLIATQIIEDTIKGVTAPYDVIFMDMMMPVMDGNEATRKIRELERRAPSTYKRNLIVALSANVGPEHTLAVMEAGCDGSLGKPFYPSTLRQLLHAIFVGEYAGFDGGPPTRPG